MKQSKGRPRKINDEDLKQILLMLENDSVTAEQYGVSKQLIYKIRKGIAKGYPNFKG
jgi:hypothetical protein